MLGITDLQLTHGTADGGQRALCDLHGIRICVDEVQAVKELASSVLALNDINLKVEVLAQTVLGCTHFACNDLG